jgi:hypothetical protein
VSISGGYALEDKTANQLVNAVTEMLEANRVSVAEMIAIILDAPVPSKLKNLAKIGFNATFKHRFKSLPEPNQNELAEVLATIAAFKSTPHKFRALLKQRLKELPHAPGGPPRKVKPEEEKAICMEIQALRGQYDTREAIRHVARKLAVSERTIYRIWGKYYPKKKKLSLPPSSRDRR